MCRYLTLHIYKYAIGLHINTIYVLVFYFIYLAHLFKIKEEKKGILHRTLLITERSYFTVVFSYCLTVLLDGFIL